MAKSISTLCDTSLQTLKYNNSTNRSISTINYYAEQYFDLLKCKYNAVVSFHNILQFNEQDNIKILNVSTNAIKNIVHSLGSLNKLSNATSKRRIKSNINMNNETQQYSSVIIFRMINDINILCQKMNKIVNKIYDKSTIPNISYQEAFIFCLKTKLDSKIIIKDGQICNDILESYPSKKSIEYIDSQIDLNKNQNLVTQAKFMKQTKQYQNDLNIINKSHNL